MSYNGSGVFSRLYNWSTEQASSPIEISKLDAQEEDIASGLSNCILRDGTGLPSTTIPWNSQALTGVSNLSAERVTVTGSTVPVNGMYSSAANTVAWASNTTLRASVNSTGNWVFAAPSSGVAMAVRGLTGAVSFESRITGATNNPGLFVTHTESTTVTQLNASGSTSGIMELATSGTARVTLGASGNVTIAAPSSGVPLTVAPVSGSSAISVSGDNGSGSGLSLTNTSASDGRSVVDFTATRTSSKNYTLGIDPDGSASKSFALRDVTRGAIPFSVSTTGNVTINAPSSGTALAVTTSSTNAAFSWTDGTISALTRFVSSTLELGTYSAHGLLLATNSNSRIAINSAGNVTVNAPSSGATLALAGNTTSTSNILTWSGNTTGGAYGRCTTTGADLIWGVENSVGTGLTGGSLGAYASVFGSINATSTVLVTNSSPRLTINSAGNVTINAASSGTELTVTGEVVATSFSGDGSLLTALNATQLTSGTVPDARFPATLPALNGSALTALNATQLTSGTIPSARVTAVDAAATINSFTIGYRQIPLSATTSGSLPTSDVGKMVAATAGITIPNSTFSAGDAVSIVNDSASAITITASITTLYWTQTGGTGTRTLAARGSCTVWFKSGTVAYISGAGLS